MMSETRTRLAALFLSLTLALSTQTLAAPLQEGPEAGPDPKVFRVCSDANNMPFSNASGEGFENKIAELLAAKLGKSIGYTWYPNSIGFVRNTLGARKCDIIMGMPEGSELALLTNPYYATAYALVFKPGAGLDGVTSLSDPRLKDKRIGIVAGTPPSDAMIANGLMPLAKPYPLAVDTRVDSSPQAMMKDLNAGAIDAGVLWGPIAGYYAMRANPKLDLVLLTQEPQGPRMSFRIAMAVRRQDKEFKRLLDRLIQENQPEIDAILLSYGVPLLDAQNRPITAAAPAHKE